MLFASIIINIKIKYIIELHQYAISSPFLLYASVIHCPEEKMTCDVLQNLKTNGMDNFKLLQINILVV